MGLEPDQGRVAVIGLGVSGLTALKNLVEQGFDVVGLERNEYIGGLWRYNEDTGQTTALKTTKTNSSKQSTAFTDYPFPEGMPLLPINECTLSSLMQSDPDYPDYPNSEQVAQYLCSYVSHFGLDRFIRLGVNIEHLAPTKRSGQGGWSISLCDGQGAREEKYDRVLVTTGPFGRPFAPDIRGIEGFEGDVIHSRKYKGPEPFQGQRVVVVGIGNTACDVAGDLCGSAKQVYLSHRSGGRVMPRYNDGQPLDHSVTRRRVYLASFLDKLPPWLAERLTSWIIDSQVRKMWPPLEEEWHLLPAPPIDHSPGIVNDDLIRHLTDRTIISVSGVDAFTSSGIIVDNEEIEVDTVIFCTGTYFDYSFLDPEADPTRHPTPGWDTAPYQNGLPYPWLYQTLFSINHPESLAFIGPCSGFSFSAFLSADLAVQAIAQIWKGGYPLPPPNEMNQWCEENYARSVRSVHRWRVPEPSADSLQLERWFNEVVGNGMNESLGWGWAGWTFWWREREMYRLIMDGVNTPFVYRLFEGRGEGGRKKWDGARDAIRWANGLA